MTRILLLLAAATITIASLNAAPIFQITPYLTCVDVNGDGTVTAYFGYQNYGTQITEVDIGTENRFIPDPPNLGQPILYLPGNFDRAVRVTFQATATPIWSFNGFAIPVAATSTPCHPASAPLSLPPAAMNAPYSQQLAAVGAQSSLSWSTTSSLPPGLTVSTSGLLAGTPLNAGTYQLTVQATDGLTTDTRTYQLVVAGQVTINDPVSLRPPGFTPQFRVVTNTAGTITATATCDTTEFVVTGGGGCTVPNNNAILGRVANSGLASNGWQVTCSGGTATAVAVCSKK